MCAACEAEIDVAASHAFLPKNILQLVRLAEQDVLGEPAGEQMWNIYFGLESGSIPWAQFEKMRLCHHAALSTLAGGAKTQKRGSVFRLRRGPLQGGSTHKPVVCAV